MGRLPAVCAWGLLLAAACLADHRVAAQSINPRTFNGYRRHVGAANATQFSPVVVIPCSGYVAAVARVSQALSSLRAH